MKPLRIFRSGFSDRWYATRSYKVVDAEKGLFEVTGKKEDITDVMANLLGQAELRGIRKGLEAAAKVADGFERTAPAAPKIRALSPADIAKEE